MSDLLKVTVKLNGCHPIHTEYPLTPGDALTLSDDGTYMKHTGLCISGFRLTDEQKATLEPTDGQIVMASGWTDYLNSVPSS